MKPIRYVVIIATAVTTILALFISFQISGQNMKEALKRREIDRQERAVQDFNNQFPTAAYDPVAEDSSDAAANRRLKNSRYDNRGGSVSGALPIDDSEQQVLISDSIDLIPALPISGSEIIVIGKILDAKAFVSNNKKAVYSEFSLSVDDVLKRNDTNIRKGDLLGVDREGGYVLYGNDKRRLYRVAGLLMPRVSYRYVLFLKNTEKTPNYEIISGYELSSNGVKSINGGELSRIFSGKDETSFIDILRKEIDLTSRRGEE